MKKDVSGELMLIIGTIYNSLNLVLLIKSGFGVSTLSSVPLSLSLVDSRISIGAWTTIVQVIAMVVMIALTKRVKIGFTFSFIVALIYGVAVDLFTILLSGVPVTMGFRVAYLVLGIVGTAIGSSLFMLCKLPILPYDLVVREISEARELSVKKVRTVYDVISLAISFGLGFFFIGNYQAIGLVTIVGVLFMGNLTGEFVNAIRKRTNVVLVSSVGKLLTKFT